MAFGSADDDEKDGEFNTDRTLAATVDLRYIETGNANMAFVAVAPGG